MKWFEEFKKKRFSLDIKDCFSEEAFSLKENHLPKSIFKYREVNDYSLKNLEDDSIWLADPSSLNDPYDCSHRYDYSIYSKDFIDLILSEHGSVFSNFFSPQTNSKISEISKYKSQILENEKPFEKFLEFLNETEPDINKKIPIEALNFILDKLFYDFSKESSTSLLDVFKLCSFSEINDSILMWSHYANYHQGFCIEYNIETLNLISRKFLFPVIYSNDMIDITDYMLKQKKDSENVNHFYLDMICLFKAKEWEYEKEWRLIFSGGVLEKAQSYNIGKAKAVYLGTKISPENQNKIIEICKRKNINCFKMQQDFKSFKLKPISIQESISVFFKD